MSPNFKAKSGHYLVAGTGPEETFPVWTADDFGFAVHAFRERHESEGETTGALIAFRTRDLIDWEVWGEVPE